MYLHVSLKLQRPHRHERFHLGFVARFPRGLVFQHDGHQHVDQFLFDFPTQHSAGAVLLPDACDFRVVVQKKRQVIERHVLFQIGPVPSVFLQRCPCHK